MPNDTVLKKMLKKETTFLVGKKGTGKSTIIERAQYQIRVDKKSLSVYINAKTVFEVAKGAISINHEIDNMLSDVELRQLIVLKTFLEEFFKSLKEELNKEENKLFQTIGNKNRDTKLKKLSDEIDNQIKDRSELNVSKKVNTSTNSLQTSDASLGAKIGNKDVSVDSRLKQSNAIEYKSDEIFVKYLDMNNLINKINKIVEICKRDNIYIFIDDYSELGKEDREKFTQHIIQPFYHIAKESIFLKIASYPDKINFGNIEKKKVQCLSIDMYDIYGGRSIPNLESKATEYTKKLIETRLKNYTELTKEDVFDFNKFEDEDECFRLLFYTSMCIPRELGIILDNCMQSHLIHGKKISKQAIIEASEKNYTEEINPHYSRELSAKNIDVIEFDKLVIEDKIIEEVIELAQTNKKALAQIDNSFFRDLQEAPTSHFRINKNYEYLLANLEFNNFIYKLGELSGKDVAEDRFQNLEIVYCFNYGLCSYKKIIYGKPKDKTAKYYQQRKFNYSNKLGDILTESRKIQCPQGHEFSISELEGMKKYGMRCSTCMDEGENDSLCEEININSYTRNDIASDNRWTISEIKILTAIYKYEQRKSPNINASILAKEIDRTTQHIGHVCKELSNNKYVIRTKKKPEWPYSYSLPNSTVDLLINAKLVINKIEC